MDMMTIRRRIMMQRAEAENWDYVLTPYDGSDEGEITAIKLNTQAGTRIRINYFCTKKQGYVYDGRSCGLQYLGYPIGGSASCYSVIGEDTTIEITTTAGFISFSIMRGHTPDADGLAPEKNDRMYGKYLKIKFL